MADKEEKVTLTREQFLTVVTEALIDAVECSSAISRLHPSEARYKASDAFDQAVALDQDVPVKVSDEMVDAGVAALWASGAVEGVLGSDRLLVARIFSAMVDAASASPSKGEQ